MWSIINKFFSVHHLNSISTLVLLTTHRPLFSTHVHILFSTHYTYYTSLSLLLWSLGGCARAFAYTLAHYYTPESKRERESNAPAARERERDRYLYTPLPTRTLVLALSLSRGAQSRRAQSLSRARTIGINCATLAQQQQQAQRPVMYSVLLVRFTVSIL